MDTRGRKWLGVGTGAHRPHAGDAFSPEDGWKRLGIPTAATSGFSARNGSVAQMPPSGAVVLLQVSEEQEEFFCHSHLVGLRILQPLMGRTKLIQ